MVNEKLDIEKLDIKKGAFSRQAKRNNMTTSQFTKEVLLKKNEKKYTELTKKRARLAKTFSKIRKKK